MFRHTLTLLSFLLLLVVPLPAAGDAWAASPPPRRVIVVLVDGLSLADLVRYRGHHLEHFLRYGAVGLMSLAGQHRSRAGAAATLGNSVPLSVGNAGELAFNTTEVVRGEEAGLTYRRRTGWDAPPAGIVLPAWPEILAANGGKAIGLLGEALHGAGLATACLGNGDLDDEWHRVSALIASDSRGRVDYGDVSRGVLKPRPEGLLPLETDEGRVLDLLSALPPAAALVVIDFGDGERLARLSRSALPAVLEAEKARLVARLDAFLGAVLATHDLAYTQVYVLGLTPAQSALEQQNLLVPVLALGADTGPGLLTSATTRRPGLVSNLDFAPSVLSFLGLPRPATMGGRPWQAQTGSGAWEELLLLNERLAFVRRARPLLVRAYVACQMAAMGLTFYAFLGRGPWRKRIGAFLPWLLLFLAAVPLAFLLLAPARQDSLFAYAATMVLGSLLLTLAYGRFWPGRLAPWLLAGAAPVAALIVDTAQGAPLQQQALLSYDPISGARFYGIGNEYMGVLIGAALLAGGAALELLKDRWGWAVATFCWLTSLFFLAHPGYGANVGGTVAAGTAFGLAALLHARVRFSWAHALALGTVAAALVAAVAWWDGTRSLAVQSHLGKAVNLVRQEGWPAVQEIIGRKLATNLRLIRYTVWTRALLSGLAVLGVLLYYQVGKVGECCRSYPKLTRSLVAMVAGSFVALVFNDSGIVAAATMMIYGIGPFLTLILTYK